MKSKIVNRQSSIHTCHRCGRCCLEVGRTFWKAGNLCPSFPFRDCDILNRRAADGDHEDNGLPCEMLAFQDGLAVCCIERDYGYEYKPLACRDYPEPGELCFRDKAFSEIVNEKKLAN